MPLSFLKKKEPVAERALVTTPIQTEAGAAGVSRDTTQLAERLQRDTAGLGLEAAQLRGTLEDTTAVAGRQQDALASLVKQLQDIRTAQNLIHQVTAESQTSVGHARQAVESVGQEVAGVVDTLRDVAKAAQQITQIAPARPDAALLWWPMP